MDYSPLFGLPITRLFLDEDETPEAQRLIATLPMLQIVNDKRRRF
jgi:hypothetical protein